VVAATIQGLPIESTAANGAKIGGSMSFKTYIAHRRITDTPQGDFTKDARLDKTLPDAKTGKS
jgi:hypothetical protein